VSNAGLADDHVISPVKRLEPWDEDDEYDKHIYNDNPGTKDSEEETDDDLARVMLEAEKNKCFETERLLQ